MRSISTSENNRERIVIRDSHLVFTPMLPEVAARLFLRKRLSMFMASATAQN
jgi:hypothetical protein